MKGIGETDAENAIANGGHFGMGGGRRDERDAGGLGDGCGFQGAGRGAFANERDHFVAGDEFLGGGGRLPGEGAVVLNDEFDGATENAAGGGEIIDGEAGAAEGRFAERGVAAGDRHEETEFDGLAGRCRGVGECGERENDDEEAEVREHGASRRKISDGRKLAKGCFSAGGALDFFRGPSVGKDCRADFRTVGSGFFPDWSCRCDGGGSRQRAGVGSMKTNAETKAEQRKLRALRPLAVVFQFEALRLNLHAGDSGVGAEGLE